MLRIVERIHHQLSKFSQEDPAPLAVFSFSSFSGTFIFTPQRSPSFSRNGSIYSPSPSCSNFLLLPPSLKSSLPLPINSPFIFPNILKVATAQWRFSSSQPSILRGYYPPPYLSIFLAHTPQSSSSNRNGERLSSFDS